MLVELIHRLPPEELEHSQLLLPLIHTPLPFLHHPCHSVSTMQLGPCPDIEAPKSPATHALGKA